MFKTMREAELLAGLTLASGESQFWPFVEIQTFIPWFHIETVKDVGDAFHRGVILAVSVSQLEQFLQHDCPYAWVERVQVITPAHLNETESWKMEVLVTLTEFSDHQGFPLGHTYEVPGGTSYSTVIVEPSEIAQSKLVYAQSS